MIHLSPEKMSNPSSTSHQTWCIKLTLGIITIVCGREVPGKRLSSTLTQGYRSHLLAVMSTGRFQEARPRHSLTKHRSNGTPQDACFWTHRGVVGLKFITVARLQRSQLKMPQFLSQCTTSTPVVATHIEFLVLILRVP